jgi:hypothetical protein
VQIVDLAGQPATILEQAAVLLVEGFVEPSGWKTMESARDEVAHVMADANGPGRPDIYMSKRVPR